MSEQHKPDPEFVEYLENEVKNPYLSAMSVMRMERVFIDQREKYEAILAARAQGGQGAEPVEFQDYDAGMLNDWGGGNVSWWLDYLRAEIERANDHWREQTGPLPLYTQPQPAVPEGWTIRLQEDGRIYFSAPSGARGSIKRRLPKDDEPISDSTLDRAFFDLCSDLLSTPTTPQADGWIAVPREAVKYLQDQWPGAYARFYEKVDELKRPQPPAGQEGEGDE